MFGIGYYGKIQTPLRQTLELHSQMQTTGLPQKKSTPRSHWLILVI